MKPHRKERLEHIFRDEITEAFRELNDPRLGFLTVTGIALTDDLRHLRVAVSVLGTAREKKDTMAALDSAKGYVHNFLSKRIDLRFLPEVTFVLDERFEEAERVFQLLRKIHKEEDE